HWHRQLRARAQSEAPATAFEVPVEGALPVGGWTLQLGGRIDQWVRFGPGALVREIKTVTRPLPEGEEVLRAAYPAYFIQLAAYLALLRVGSPPLGSVAGGMAGTCPVRGEVVFVETATGLTQTVLVAPADDALLAAQLERVREFLDLRLRARDRLRGLQFRPPFERPRPGQETAVADLKRSRQSGKPILLEAPTGFGKTGVLLEFALDELRTGACERVLYLSGKSTGQLQVARTLEAMAPAGDSCGPAAWIVRPKGEHCINHAFHCVREDCRYLDGVERRWPSSGLSRFYLMPRQPRDLASLREAGREACVCPYEITRASLPFNDLWIGDYNYVFSPGSRGIFYRQPGFEPARTLLIVDEAHNLPPRVADAHSHAFPAGASRETATLLEAAHPRAEVTSAWTAWAAFLNRLSPCAALGAGAEADARELIGRLGESIRSFPVDYAALSPTATESIWALPGLGEELAADDLPRLWWCRRPGELSITCLDAAAAIGSALREFGTVVLASATPGPERDFAEALGLFPPGATAPSAFLRGSAGSGRLAADSGDCPAADASRASPALEAGRFGALSKRQTRKLAARVLSGADLLRQGDTAAESGLAPVRAWTPWRDGAYDVAYDVRVDTSFQHRGRHAGTTAVAVAALARAADRCVAVFFPSYAYAEMIVAELQASRSDLRIAIQPRSLELADQASWAQEGLGRAHALFLILGSGFAESIDLLGGRVGHGMVVGPALPEVNAVQRARAAELAPLGRERAFRRVYQIPGMQKVNQALGRLVRSPGQRAKVLLHCRRFAEPAYRDLLVADYRGGVRLETDEDLDAWLGCSQSNVISDG
ncbi:MAG: helicase C-terminal domain-containing protein, partial [Opitutaceae bacterium]